MSNYYDYLYVSRKEIREDIKLIAEPPIRMKHEKDENIEYAIDGVRQRNYRNASCDGLISAEKQEKELSAKMKKKARNQRYYQKHKAKLLKNQKDYNNEKKENIKQYNKEYYKANDEEIKQKQQDIRDQMKEEGIKPKIKIVVCECGWKGRQSSLSQHKKIAKRHSEYLIKKAKEEKAKAIKREKAKEEKAKKEEKPKKIKIRRKKPKVEKKVEKPKVEKKEKVEYLNEYEINESVYMDY